MPHDRRYSDQTLARLIQDLQDFREMDADWKTRHDNSAHDFRKSITQDISGLQGDVSKLMVPYKAITWIAGLIAVEIGVRSISVLIELFKGHMR